MNSVYVVSREFCNCEMLATYTTYATSVNVFVWNVPFTRTLTAYPACQFAECALERD